MGIGQCEVVVGDVEAVAERIPRVEEVGKCSACD